jgi:hypothetical protein
MRVSELVAMTPSDIEEANRHSFAINLVQNGMDIRSVNSS